MLAALPMVHYAMVAQSVAEQNAPPPSGTEYYVAFMQNQEDEVITERRFMGVMITSQVATTGQVEYRDPTTSSQVTRQFSVTPGAITSITIPNLLEMREEMAQPAVHITARDPISVFVLNSRSLSGSGYAAIPIDLWKNTYLPMTLPNSQGGNSGEFTVIAAYNNTLLTLYPSARTRYRENGEQIDLVLSKGETIFLQGRAEDVGADLSASDIISASQPIGVIAGHVQTSITPDKSTPTNIWQSHHAMMLLPDSLWGKEYYTVPLRGSGDRFRMMAALNGTEVNITHYPPGGSAETVTVTLQRGMMYDSATINGKPITGPVHWSSNQPIVLTQLRTSGPYINGSGVSEPENSPAMIPTVATSQFSSYAVFAAPDQISTDQFTTHTLTIIARDGSMDDPLGVIRLDGRSLVDVDPARIVRRIGTGNYYYTRVRIASGGHILTSSGSAPFTATLSGNNGKIARDTYTWIVPFWNQQIAPDITPPHVLGQGNITGNRLTVTFSDSTPSYFSGLLGAEVVGSPGWKMSGTFVPPGNLDATVQVTFIATADPSGPLDVAVTDRAGNIDTVRLSEGICIKPAFAAKDSLIIRTDVGVTQYDTVRIQANPCGDSAQIGAIDLGSGNASAYIQAAFDAVGYNGPITIAPQSSVNLLVWAQPGTPSGTYTTTVSIDLGDSTLALPLLLVVAPPAGVVDDEASSRMLSIRPNPFTSSVTLGFEHPLGRDATITISDPLGRVLRTFTGNGGAGELTWDGTDDNGRPAPAGVYYVSIEEKGRKAVRSVMRLR